MLIAPCSTEVLEDCFYARLVQILVLPQHLLLLAVLWHGLRHCPSSTWLGCWHSCRWNYSSCAVFLLWIHQSLRVSVFFFVFKVKTVFEENCQQKNCFLGTDLGHSYCCLPLTAPRWCWGTAERGCSMHVISCSLAWQWEGSLAAGSWAEFFSGYGSPSTSRPSCFVGDQEFS